MALTVWNDRTMALTVWNNRPMALTVEQQDNVFDCVAHIENGHD